MHEHGDYTVSTDAASIDVDAVHAYLTRSYWARGIPKEVVERSVRGSLCFALLHRGKQVGFARVVTDRATFAYLADVHVLEEHRGRGLARRLMEAVVAHPDLQGLRRFLLATRDAHGLYAKLGFVPLAHPEYFMEVNRPYVTPGSK
jgi:ribosomal protein S18 acetylase RimI-like enzyme